MCNIIKKTRHKTVTGYKVAIKRLSDGALLSPAIPTVEYKVGKVPKPDRAEQKPFFYFYNKILLDKEMFKEDFYGKTMIFKLRCSCNRFLENYVPDGYKAVILKITLSKNIHYCKYGSKDPYGHCGEHIDKIIECK